MALAWSVWKKQKDSSTIPTRISRLDKSSLLDWYNNTLMELGASFDRYRHHGLPYSHVTELMDILDGLHKEIASRERNS